MHVEKYLVFLQISLYTAAHFNKNLNVSIKFDKLFAINFQENLISVDKKDQLDVTFCIFISLLIVAQHVSGNHVPIIRS